MTDYFVPEGTVAHEGVLYRTNFNYRGETETIRGTGTTPSLNQGRVQEEVNGLRWRWGRVSTNETERDRTQPRKVRDVWEDRKGNRLDGKRTDEEFGDLKRNL